MGFYLGEEGGFAGIVEAEKEDGEFWGGVLVGWCEEGVDWGEVGGWRGRGVEGQMDGGWNDGGRRERTFFAGDMHVNGLC